MEERKIAYAKFFSLAGTNIFNVFINLWAISTFGTTKELAFILSIAGISSFLFSLLGGVLSSGSNVLNIVRYSDLISFMFCIVAVGAQLFISNNFVILLALVFVLNINVSLTSPSIKRIIGIVVEKNKIVSFNSFLSVGTQTITVLMPLITSVMFSRHVLSITGAIAINGLSFFISFVFLNRINVQVSKLKTKKKVNYITAIKTVKQDGLLSYLIIAGFFSNIFLSGFNLIIPSVAIRVLNDASFYGVLISTESIAAIVGLASIHWIKLDPEVSNERRGLILSGVIMIVLAIFPMKFLFFINSFSLSFFYSRFNVGLQSYIQIKVENKFIGYIFSLTYISSNIAIPIGNILFGYLIDKHISLSIYIVAIGIIIINIVWFIMLRFKNKKQKR